MLTTTEHPDAITDYHLLKAIRLGSMQAIEDKAIAEYISACETMGKEEAEKIFFKHFNKTTHGKETVFQIQ